MSLFDDYPPVTFSFKVQFTGSLGLSDTSFQEVSGISAELETEEISEGGANEYVHLVPKAIKHGNLVLKRGIATLDSPLMVWCTKVLGSDLMLPIEPQHVLVSLLGADGISIRAWSFSRAYPVKWSFDAFNSTKNDVAIETIELKYDNATRLM